MRPYIETYDDGSQMWFLNGHKDIIYWAKWNPIMVSKW
jgi:hypothetical protein